MLNCFWVAWFHLGFLLLFFCIQFFSIFFLSAIKLFMLLWFSSGHMLFFFLSSYLCVAFSFCFSFLLPANDNQHTDGKPVAVSLSSLLSFTSLFRHRHTAWYKLLFISCPALSACCRYVSCRLFCSDSLFPRPMLMCPAVSDQNTLVIHPVCFVCGRC